MRKSFRIYLSWIVFLFLGSFLAYSCLTIHDETLSDSELKKGKKITTADQSSPSSVDQSDLYGDLWVHELNTAGVPVLYELPYAADYQDETIYGIIDVINPKLDGPFILNSIVRDDKGYPITVDPGDGSDPYPKTTEIEVDPGEDGFLHEDQQEYSPLVLYDAEGELLPEVALHVIAIEQGRLNLIRSPEKVLTSRIGEVIKNFGDGTVAEVIRDYCGRLYMVRTSDALASGYADKPIDSPLENLAIYYELMLHGFDGALTDNGLSFLCSPAASDFGGFNLQSRLDSRWPEGALNINNLNSLQEKREFVANLAASCVAAGSDKSNFLTIDEIVLLNQFMGIPQPDGDEAICYFEYERLPIRKMDKTTKDEYTVYRYYIDYSNFAYTREKFENTLVDFCTYQLAEDGTYVKKPVITDIPVHSILNGTSELTNDEFAIYRYTQPEGTTITGAAGFASQADDYVQALEVIHNNEEFLVWKFPTPTWDAGKSFNRTVSPFNFTPYEPDHGKDVPHGNRSSR